MPPPLRSPYLGIGCGGPFKPLDRYGNMDEEGHMVAKMTLSEGTFFLASVLQASHVCASRAMVCGGLGLLLTFHDEGVVPLILQLFFLSTPCALELALGCV